MPTPIETDLPLTLADASVTPRGPVHPSPADWRDETLYFLLPDRFSDGREAERPLYTTAAPESCQTPDKAAWMAAGKTWQGGVLKGIESKLDYLRDLGVTTLWIGPIWRQRAELDTYHGYGIQNFLDVDPRFGTRQDLRDLVDAAHARGMYILLDIIYNHTGNNWFYRNEENGRPVETLPYRYAPPFPFHSWRDENGRPTANIHTLNDGVWPREFQNPDWYTRAGQIGKWDHAPWESALHDANEYRRGDFFELKDLNLARGDVLSAIIQVYRYWIALSDCDGFRIDTVKHISYEASRHFCGAIREYAEAIGKENFLLLGEVTGGAEMAHNYLEIFGRNLDAVLDIGDPTIRLANMVRGQIPADWFFQQYGGHDYLGGHRETGRFHVSILDDHDMVGRPKYRFAATVDDAHRAVRTAHAVGVLLTTLGMPCIYYGTEQALDGNAGYHDRTLEPVFHYEDRYVRETMFGGAFGPFMSSGCHVFNPNHPTYRRIAAINRVRQQDDLVGLTCRRGRQYLREISIGSDSFHFPQAGEIVAWSRIIWDQELLAALNTHNTETKTAVITVDASLHREGSTMTIWYRGDWSDEQLANPPTDQTEPVRMVNGRATVTLTLPPGGMALLA